MRSGQFSLDLNAETDYLNFMIKRIFYRFLLHRCEIHKCSLVHDIQPLTIEAACYQWHCVRCDIEEVQARNIASRLG